MNDVLADVDELLVSGGLMEPFLHDLSVKLLEALHPRTVSHHDDTFHYLLLVLPDVFQPEEEEQLKVLENVRVYSLHEFHVVAC